MVLVPEEDGGSRAYRGVMVAGCPMGEAGFVDAWLRAQVSSIESYIEKTVLSPVSYTHLTLPTKA